MGIRGILKKDGVARRAKRNLVFSKTINHVKEFDEDLPVLTITKPNYEAPYDPTDNDDDIIYWWEMDDEIVDWDDENSEWEIEGYTWDDVEDLNNSSYRSNAFDDALEEAYGSDSDDSSTSSSSSSSSYEEETVSDDDSEYQLDDEPQKPPVQLDVEALKAEQSKREEPKLVAEPEPIVDAAPRSTSYNSDDNLDVSRGSSTGGPRRARPRRTSRASSLVQAAKQVAAEIAINTEPEPPGPEPKPAETAAALLSERPAGVKRRQSLPVQLPTQMPRFSDRVPKPEVDPIIPENPKRESSNADLSAEAAAAVAASILGTPPVSKQPVIEEEPKKEKKATKSSSHHSRKSTGSKKSSAEGTKEANKNGLKKKKKEKRDSDPSVKNKVKHIKKQPRPQGVDDPNAVKDYSWEKPDWSKENKLKQTKRGRLVRKGANLAKPITMINRALNDMMDAKLLAWGKPEWAKKAEILKSTQLGNAVKQGGSLARKITHIASDPAYRKELGWEKPEWTEKRMVKETEKGRAVKKGECISKAITHIRDDEEVTSKYAWEKPEWAKKKMVRSTKEGEKVKKGEYLSTGITNNQEAKDKYQWEKPEWTQRVMKRSSTVDSSSPSLPQKSTSMHSEGDLPPHTEDDSGVSNGTRNSFSRYKRTSSLPK